MCFPRKKDHHPKEKRRKQHDQGHHGDQPLPPGAPGDQEIGTGQIADFREEDLTVAEAPDHMPECDLEPFSWRRQHFTADQLL